MPIIPVIDESWLRALEREFESPYLVDLKAFLLTEKGQHKVYPPSGEIFAAYNATPFDRVKVVILGQDPYHGSGQAHGLSFSVPRGIPLPPSLRNIFRELQTDLGYTPPASGDLGRWASQGVLLLNATLTVRHNKAGSHQKKGWETFTDASIKALSSKREHLVFLLWGNFAKAKKGLIDQQKHLILEAAHPSPFSAHSGFFGCRHFSKANAYLGKNGIDPVDWDLSWP